VTFVPLLLALAVAPQEQRPVFRVTADAVRVDVFVGKDGRGVSGLGIFDFELYDGGERREIGSVTVAEMPLNVLLVLDASESVAGASLTHLRSAAAGFLDELAPEDRAGLLTFSHHLSLRSGLALDRALLKGALEDVEALGGTAWHDALFAALEMLETVRERPMVLLFTDGADTYSWLREEQVLPLVQESNAVVYAVAGRESFSMADLATSRGQEELRRDQRESRRRTRLLTDVAQESGGRLIEARSTEGLREIFLEILAEMKTRYVLSYVPPAPVREGWHDLDVRVRRKGVDVRARRGYYYESRTR
jgi:VWFA-related protein